LVLQCINGVSSNPVEGRTKIWQLKNLILTLWFNFQTYIYTCVYIYFFLLFFYLYISHFVLDVLAEHNLSRAINSSWLAMISKIFSETDWHIIFWWFSTSLIEDQRWPSPPQNPMGNINKQLFRSHLIFKWNHTEIIPE
jgi:hypothetical protein